MHRRIITAALLIACVGLFVSSLPAQARGGRKLRLAVLLQGTDKGEIRHIDTDGDGENDTMANCFDVDLLDLRTGRKIGTASDCLSEGETFEATEVDYLDENFFNCDAELPNPVACTSVKLVDTTFFRLKRFGTLVAQGPVTLQPALDEETLKTGVTHITGSIPAGNNIKYGTGIFRRAKGSVRLSGAVDMSMFPANDQDPEQGNIISFDCIFVIELDRVRRRRPDSSR